MLRQRNGRLYFVCDNSRQDKREAGAVTAEEICTVHDVFLNESRAREFAEQCNELGLSPIHIYDVVQDAIG